MNNTKPVPAIYYNEMVNEMARELMRLRSQPLMQQKRIDAVIASGLDYEIMSNGHQVPLTKLMEFKANAEKDYEQNYERKFAEWKKYKATHEPINGLKGDLKAAKNAAQLRKMKTPSFTDTNYNYYHKLITTYFLSNKQSEDLMDFMMDLDIIK